MKLRNEFNDSNSLAQWHAIRREKSKIDSYSCWPILLLHKICELKWLLGIISKATENCSVLISSINCFKVILCIYGYDRSYSKDGTLLLVENMRLVHFKCLLIFEPPHRIRIVLNAIKFHKWLIRTRIQWLDGKSYHVQFKAHHILLSSEHRIVCIPLKSHIEIQSNLVASWFWMFSLIDSLY